MTEFMHAVRQDWIVTLPYLIIYVAATGLDIAFGFVVAFQKRVLSSTISRQGMMRKVLMVGTVLLAALVDGILPSLDITVMGLSLRLTFGALGCTWWMIHEVLSLTEHAAILGLPLPKRLKDALAVVRNTLDSGPDSDNSKPKKL